MSVDVHVSHITAYTPAVTPEEPWMTVIDWQRSIKIVRKQGRQSMKSDILKILNKALEPNYLHEIEELISEVEEME